MTRKIYELISFRNLSNSFVSFFYVWFWFKNFAIGLFRKLMLFKGRLNKSTKHSY